jgi:hypothetical protein
VSEGILENVLPFWMFSEDNRCVLPLSAMQEELKTPILEVSAETKMFFKMCDRRLKIDLIFREPIVAQEINLPVSFIPYFVCCFR